MAHDAHKQLSSRRPGVLLVYGEKRANAGLAGELELDGYVVHRASHPATLRERCTPGEVDLVIFGKSPHRGFDVLRALRGGELAPGASGVRVLWLSASSEPAAMGVLRAFEAGADDVARTPHGYAELLSFDFKSPVNVVLTSHAPERRFVAKLMHPRNSGLLESWVKAPDVGFYKVEFAYQPGGTGRSKRGRFNPDFFILLKDSDTVVVVETKANGDDSWENKGKTEAALAHFKAVNELLKRSRRKRRYVFQLLAPEDYDRFFEAVKKGSIAEFRSTLQAAVEAKIPEPVPTAA